MFIEITKAEYLEGYKLRIHFNNGEIRIADLEASLEGPIFESLKNIEELTPPITLSQRRTSL